jgi:hypothetical protein
MGLPYIQIGFFDVQIEKLRSIGPSPEPTVTARLDYEWTAPLLENLETNTQAEFFWYGGPDDREYLMSSLPHLDVARLISDHLGDGCVIIHRQSGLVLYPPKAVIHQARINDWPVPSDVSSVTPFRSALERQMCASARNRLRFGPPATEGQLASIEAELGMALPGELRNLYCEFDGFWVAEPGQAAPSETCEDFTKDLETFTILPLSRLPRGRDYIMAMWSEQEKYTGAQYVEEYSAQLRRSLAFEIPEYGASFLFMTDQSAWDIGKGEIGKWDHDGDVGSLRYTLKEYLTETGLGISLNDQWRRHRRSPIDGL